MSPQNDDNEFFGHLTDNAVNSLKHADAIAKSFGSLYIGTEHLLLGVLAQESSIGSKMLENAGLTLDRAKLALNLTNKPTLGTIGAKSLSAVAKLTLTMAHEMAQDFNQDHVGTEHILYSILRQKTPELLSYCAI